MHKKRNNFTLIEMLVVVAILGILAAMVYPSYLKHREKAAIIEAKGHMTKIVTALSEYKTTYVDYELIEGNLDGNDTISWADLKATLMATDINTNPRQTKFLTEDFESPWKTGNDYNGFDYRIKLDLDEDGIIAYNEWQPNEGQVSRDIVVYLKNPNLRTTDEDIRSWD